jgi:hypothetical protein
MLKSFTIKNIFIILLLIIFLVLLKCALQSDNLDKPNKNYDLQKDGFVVIKNVLTDTDIEHLQKSCYENDYYNTKNLLIHNVYLLDNVKNYIKWQLFQIIYKTK